MSCPPVLCVCEWCVGGVGWGKTPWVPPWPRLTRRASQAPPFGESLRQLDAIIAKLEPAAPAAAPAPTPAAPAPAPAKQQQQKQKQKQKQKQPQPKKKKGNAPTAEQPLFTKLDLRVGKIVKVWPHPKADRLWCEEIDVGEGEPRQVASGLREWYSEEEMLGRRLVAVCNLKPRNLVG